MAQAPKVQLVIDGKDNTKNAFGAVSKSLTALESKTASLSRSMAGLLAGAVSIGTLKTIADINSEWVDMSSRLRRVTADEEEFQAVTERLGEVAESTWTGLTETIESFLGMQGPLADMGLTMQEQVNFVSGLNNALVVSGAKGEVAASVTDALTKAMALGKLSGQNLNTVIAKGGYVAELLADRLGVTTSELLKLGKQGEITSQVLYEAIGVPFEAIAEKAEAMPATVADAMGRVGEAFKGAFRDEDLMEPLTDALLELANVLKDPAVREGLANLASGMVVIAAAAVQAGAAIGKTGDDLGYWMAKVSGNVDEITRAEKLIEGFRKKLASASTEEQRKELEGLIRTQEAYIERLVSKMTGMTAAQREAANEQAEIAKQAAEEQKKIMRDKVNDLRDEQSKLVSDAKKTAGELLKIENDAAKDLKTLKDERLDIEKTYRQAIADLDKAAGSGDATYANAQAMKVKAREALIRGELKEAQEYARGALGILQQIKEDGGNTYGFVGFAKELEAIELAAKDAEIADAEKRVKDAQTALLDMNTIAEKLGNIKIGFDLDQGQVEAVKAQLQAIGNAVQITPQAASAAGATIQPIKLPVEAQIDEEPVKQKIYRIGNTFTDKPLTIPLEPEKIEPGEIQQAAGDTEIDTAVELDQESAVVLEGDIKSMVENLEKLAAVQVKVQTAPAGGAGEPPGFARGGHIRGPGTGTSDSILARLSDGEYVIRAAAVRKYGLNMLNALNGMHLPQFATGGLVDRLAEQAAGMEPSRAPSLGTLNFNLPGGESFSVQAAADNWGDLRRTAIKYGKPR